MLKWWSEHSQPLCIHCEETHYKWICPKCHEKIATQLTKALQLQLDVAVLNAGNPELIAKLAVMDGDECVGLVVPDSLSVINDLGLIVPAYFKESLNA